MQFQTRLWGGGSGAPPSSSNVTGMSIVMGPAAPAASTQPDLTTRTYLAAQASDVASEYQILKIWAQQHVTEFQEAQRRLALAGNQVSHINQAALKFEAEAKQLREVNYHLEGEKRLY